MVSLIIIRGSLGVGKSTISKKIAEKISAEYFSVDELLSKEKLDFINKNLGYISENNFLKINDLIIPKIKLILEKGTNVIIDGNFYHKVVLEDLINRLIEFEPKVFTLKASKETCIKRDEKRKNPHGKDAAIAVHNLVSRFDYGINIDNSKPDSNISINKILELI